MLVLYFAALESLTHAHIQELFTDDVLQEDAFDSRYLRQFTFFLFPMSPFLTSFSNVDRCLAIFSFHFVAKRRFLVRYRLAFSISCWQVRASASKFLRWPETCQLHARVWCTSLVCGTLFPTSSSSVTILSNDVYVPCLVHFQMFIDSLEFLL